MKDIDPGGMSENNWGTIHSDREVIKSLFEAVIFYSPTWRMKRRKPRENAGVGDGDRSSVQKQGSKGKDWGRNMLDPV